MMTTGRNDDCWCGNGRKYKHCHLQIDAAPEDQKYFVSQAVYARNCKIAAQHCFDSGVYHWLAEQLAEVKPKRVLDIGCGSGHGLVALREVLGADIQIVAIDENRACLQEARETLRRSDLDAQVINRVTFFPTADGYHPVAEPLAFPSDAACSLIESDVCNDQYLLPALRASGQFDAVTIWLTGVHTRRLDNIKVPREINTGEAHRLYVQNATYDLANLVLRTGGILQVCDRNFAPSSQLARDDVLNGHAEQASLTSMHVRSLQFRLYDDAKTPMLVTLGSSGHMPADLRPAMLSIVSEKT